MRAMYSENPGGWILPWAILPEIDDLVLRELGSAAEQTWLDDLAAGAFSIEWGRHADMAAAHRISQQYAALDLGLVHTIVMATSERLRADIATFDLRHFGSVHSRARATPPATRSGGCAQEAQELIIADAFQFR